jgi:hypothetical protein
MPESLRDSAVVARFKAKMADAGKSRCQVCRWKPPRGLAALHDDASSMLHAHHVVPIACGGADRESNLVLVCPTHHAISHKLGRMVQSGPRAERWRGPRTPEELLFEIRLMEKEPEAFAEYIAHGRKYENALAERRRAAFRVTDTTNRTTCTAGEILSRATANGVSADVANA